MPGAMLAKRRLAGVGATCSGSESSAFGSGRARRIERGEWSCGEDTGVEGGESAKLEARAVCRRLDDAVGVMSRLPRGLGCSW